MVALDDKHFLSIAERSAYIWTCGLDEPRKLVTVRNMPDSSTPFFANTCIVNTFDHHTSSASAGGRHQPYNYHHHDIGVPSQPLHVLYCVAGHRMHAGKIPMLDEPSKDRFKEASVYSPD